jgi:hypothetical protein
MTSLAQIAFEAYGNYTEGVTFDGRPIPPWEELGDSIRAAWEAAAEAVAAEVELDR